MNKSFSRRVDDGLLEVKIGFDGADFKRVFSGGQSPELLAKLMAPDFGDLNEAQMGEIVTEFAATNAKMIEQEAKLAAGKG